MDIKLLVPNVDLTGPFGNGLTHYTPPGVDKVSFIKLVFNAEGFQHFSDGITDGFRLTFSTLK